MSANRPPASFRADVEGLRGLAVLLVVACHCGFVWCSGGFVGVDVFFVVSGYLITGLLVAEFEAHSRLDFARFYARRVRRLLPASMLVLVATVLVGATVLAPQELAATSRAARAAALYLSNVYFDLNAADYFAPDVASNPILHTWSLGVEEQFYFVWPMLLLLGLRFVRSRIALAAVLSVVALGSIATCVWATAFRNTFAFYELPPRAWEFAAGGLLALRPALNRPKSTALWVVAGFGGFVTVLAAAVLVPAGRGFPGSLALIPVAGTLAMLAAGRELPHGGVSVLLEARPFQYLGARSYSWYLWHWPFIVFLAAVAPGVSVFGKTLAAAGSLLAAALTFRLLERPVRQNEYLIARPALCLCAAVGAAVVGAAATSAVTRYADVEAKGSAMMPITSAIADVADLPREQCVSLGQSVAVKTCGFGDQSARDVVVLFGDSHAMQWFNPLNAVAKARHWRLVTVVKSGCAASDIEPISASVTDAICKAWRFEALRQIAALKPSVVLVASFTGSLGRQTPGDSDAWRLRLQEGTRRTFAALDGAGLRVVALRDTPMPPFDVPTCLARAAFHAWFSARACDFDLAASQNPAAYGVEQDAARGLHGIRFLDLTDQICVSPVCSAVQNHVIAYRDDNHLTGTFAASLSQQLGMRLDALAAD